MTAVGIFFVRVEVGVQPQSKGLDQAYRDCYSFACVLVDVPSHLHYIMLELIKNSMRATVDFHGLDEMDNNPIRVVIADGEGNEVGLQRLEACRMFSICLYVLYPYVWFRMQRRVVGCNEHTLKISGAI